MRLIGHLATSIGFLYTLVVVTLFITVADQQLGRFGYLPTNPTLCALILLSPFAVVSTIGKLSGASKTIGISTLWYNRHPYGAFALIAATSLLLSALPGAYWLEGGKWIFLISYGLLISILASFIPQQSMVCRNLSSLSLVALSILLWSLIVDLRTPGTFSLLNERAAGLPGNANFAALVTVMICAAGLRYDAHARPLMDSILLLLAGTIVCITMSRSGLLNFALLMGVFLYLRLSDRGFEKRAVVTTLSVILASTLTCIVLVWLISSSSGALQQNNRLTRLLNNQQVDDGSAGSRLAAVRDSLRLINESPVFGHGTGHSRTMQELPHNLYLMQWINNGVFGLVALLGFLLLTFMTFKRRHFRPGQAFMAVTTLGGVFSHNILDQRCFLILLGVLLGASITSDAHRIPATAK